MNPSFSRVVRCSLLVFTLALVPTFAEVRNSNASSAEKREREPGGILVNVFGGVEIRGTYSLAPESTLLDAIGSAGGWTRTANPRKVSIVRGPAGQKPTVTVHDVEAILRGDAVNPKIEDHDSVFVPEKIF